MDLSNLKFEKLILIGLIIIAIISISFNIFYTPNFVIPSETGQAIIAILSEVDDKFILISNNEKEIYGKAAYSYAPIYLNLSTSEGWSFIFNEAHLELSRKTRRDLKQNDCAEIEKDLELMKTKYLITYDQDCENLKKCNFLEKNRIKNVCLYYVN